MGILENLAGYTYLHFLRKYTTANLRYFDILLKVTPGYLNVKLFDMLLHITSYFLVVLHSNCTYFALTMMPVCTLLA